MLINTALIITSIAAPNTVLADCAKQSALHGCRFILIGDSKSPADFSLADCDFWSLARQKSMPFSLAGKIPESHYARKNLGYLQAISEGAKVIIETDDDNFPRKEFWQERQLVQSAKVIADAGWVNVYRYFTDSTIWPRGFPLEFLKTAQPLLGGTQDFVCPIQQGLADENPDVDAIYRLTFPLPQRFASGASVALGERSWCPFNSQNTTWFKEAFPLLYLPSYCSFRMTDIWRSFIAQRICWANDWKLLFHGPTVWQERNEHSLLKDLADEVVGYLNNASMCEMLATLDMLPGEENLPKNLLTCYSALISRGLVGEGELALLESWLEDLSEMKR